MYRTSVKRSRKPLLEIIFRHNWLRLWRRKELIVLFEVFFPLVHVLSHEEKRKRPGAVAHAYNASNIERPKAGGLLEPRSSRSVWATEPKTQSLWKIK